MGAITTTPTDRASIPARLSILCSRCIGCPRKQEAFLASLSSMPTCPLCPVPQTQYLATALNYLAVSPTSWIGSAALSHDLHLPQRDLGPKSDLGATTSDAEDTDMQRFVHHARLYCRGMSPRCLLWLPACGVSRLSLVVAGRFTFAPVIEPVYLYCVVLRAEASGVVDCCLRFRPMLDGLESLGTTSDRVPDIDVGAGHLQSESSIACHGDGWLHRTDARIRRVMLMCRRSGGQWAASYIWTREADRRVFVYRPMDGPWEKDSFSAYVTRLCSL